MPRGLGFFPDAVVIRSNPVGPAAAALYNDDDDEYAYQNDGQTAAVTYRPWAANTTSNPTSYPSANWNLTSTESSNAIASSSNSIPVSNAMYPPRRGAGMTQGSDWEMWKEWNTNPTGHGGRSRAPPVFVKPLGYDLPATEAEAVVEVAVEKVPEPPDEAEEKAAKMDGTGVADWYMSLFSGKGKPKERPKDSDALAAELLDTNGTSRASTSLSTPSAAQDTTTPPLAPTSVASPALSSALSSRNSPGPVPPPAPIRIHSSEWFIRRALVNKPATAPRAATPSSIASLVDIESARTQPPPVPRFRYALGRDNAGYARLEALGWAGGGLGRPEGWNGDVFERPGSGQGVGSRSGNASRPDSEARDSAPEADGVVDLTADSDDDDDSDEAQPVHGPGRTAPVPTVLKLDRFGLGRKSGKLKVTHSAKEIERTYRRSRGQRSQHAPEEGQMAKKEKLKWKERDRRDRESRARIAAALNL